MNSRGGPPGSRARVALVLEEFTRKNFSCSRHVSPIRAHVVIEKLWVKKLAFMATFAGVNGAPAWDAPKDLNGGRAGGTPVRTLAPRILVLPVD
jgi:hypothetical protein